MRASAVSALLTVAAVLAFGVPSLANATDIVVNTSPDRVQEFTPAQNDPSGWPDCADGTKVDLDGQNRFTYTLTSPASLLVIKAATWNFIWDSPTAGVYGVPTAPDGKVHAISHVIVCGAMSPSQSESASESQSGSQSASESQSGSQSASESQSGSQTGIPSITATGTSSVSAPGSTTGTSSDGAVAPGSTSSTAPSASSPGLLPRTGGDLLRLVGLALAALGLGAALWFVGRRRGTRPSHI